MAGFTVLASTDTDVNGSFGILIFAIDSKGDSVKSFSGDVAFSASSGVITPTRSGAFSDGLWKGVLTVSDIDDADKNYVRIFVYVNDGNCHTGRSGLIHVLPLLPNSTTTPNATATPIPEFSYLPPNDRNAPHLELIDYLLPISIIVVITIVSVLLYRRHRKNTNLKL